MADGAMLAISFSSLLALPHHTLTHPPYTTILHSASAQLLISLPRGGVAQTRDSMPGNGPTSAPLPPPPTTSTTATDPPPRDLERLFAELGLRKYGHEAEMEGEEKDEAVADGTYNMGVYMCLLCYVEEGWPLSPHPGPLSPLAAPSETTLQYSTLPYLNPPSSCPPPFPPRTQPAASAPGSGVGSWSSAHSSSSPSSSTAS